MDFEWDPAKREKNLETQEGDFLVATQVLSQTHLLVRTDDQPEPRWMAIAPLPDEHVPTDGSGPLCTVVYARREDTYRILSARRARTDERDAYRTKVTGGDPS